MGTPWELVVWLVCQNGRPFDYRFSRAAAFQRAKELRDGVPSGDWSVDERRAHLSILEQEGRADELPEGASSPRSTSDSPPSPTPVQGREEALAGELTELANCIEAEPAFNPLTNATVVRAMRDAAGSLKSSSLPRGK